MGTDEAADAPRRSRLARRSLLQGCAAFALSVSALHPGRVAAQAAPDIDATVLQTVLGPVDGAAIELAVAHEHLFVDFNGPTTPDYMNVDWADALGASVNKALELRAQGVNLLIDWTNLGVGRNVFLLRDVSRRSGVHIVCPTGIYKSLVPPQYAEMSVTQIADAFAAELTRGVDGTPIRAGFIKIATTEVGPTGTDTTLHRAAAIAARETGATIALHSPFVAATDSVVATLAAEGFGLERFVWGHAQPSPVEAHKAMAARGATIQYDAIGARSDPFFQGPTDDASMLARIEAMVETGYDRQVIVSADGSVFVNPQKWQYDRDATYVYAYFAAKLEERLGKDMARQILRDNVIHAFRKPDAA